MIEENVNKLLESIPKTNPFGEKVTLVAAVKLQSPEDINRAVCAGIRDIGDNHVQEFKDKYDLINWYFDKLLLESFAHMGEGRTVYEGLVKKFEYIRQERVFFAGAFRSDDYNSLKEHDFQLILEFYTQRIREKTGQEPEETIGFLLEMYCQGSIYMTVQWVLGGMKATPEEMAGLLVDAMPEAVARLFKELGLL